MSLRETLLKYPEHISDVKKQNKFIVNLLKQNRLVAVITELETILVNGTIDQICETLMFLRDISLFQHQDPSFSPIITQFRKALPASNIFSIMEKNLYSENQQIRHNTIYAFGKMTFKENAQRLQKATQTYKKTYPSELKQLLEELSWLENQK